MKLKNLPRPADQSTDYRFFKNETTGHDFKAKHVLSSNMLNQPTLSITLTESDAGGKAIPNADGNIHVYTHNHIFTQAELADPTFDPELRLGQVLATAITEKEKDITARAALKAMGEKWGTSQALRVDPTPPR